MSTSGPNSGPVADNQGRSTTPFALLLGIVLFLIAETFFFLFLLFDAWSGKFSIPSTLFLLPAEFVGSEMFSGSMFSVAGGGLGGATYSILAFHRHVSVRNDFSSVYAWGFFLSALVAMVLGGIVFALIQGGLLVFASGAAPATSEVAQMGYLGLGFLAGFGWNSVTEKLRQLINQLFGGSADRQVAPGSPAGTPGARPQGDGGPVRDSAREGPPEG